MSNHFKFTVIRKEIENKWIKVNFKLFIKFILKQYLNMYNADMKLAQNQFEYNKLYNLRNMCLQPRQCVQNLRFTIIIAIIANIDLKFEMKRAIFVQREQTNSQSFFIGIMN